MTNPAGEALQRLAAAELAKRREGNPRYSLRAFAASVGVDHGTLSRLLRGVRMPRPDVAARLTAALQEDRDTTALLRLIEAGSVSGDARRTAILLGIPVDRVHVAVQRLCVTGRVRMEGDRWAARS